jgi:hypothetical protein
MRKTGTTLARTSVLKTYGVAMLLSVKDAESKDQAAYVQACTTNVPIELESLCYHSCPFVRARAVSRVAQFRLPHRVVKDPAPSVLASVIMRKDLQDDQMNSIGVHLRYLYDAMKDKSAYKKYRVVWIESLRILNGRINALSLLNAGSRVPVGVSRHAKKPKSFKEQHRLQSLG